MEIYKDQYRSSSKYSAGNAKFSKKKSTKKAIRKKNKPSSMNCIDFSFSINCQWFWWNSKNIDEKIDLQ